MIVQAPQDLSNKPQYLDKPEVSYTHEDAQAPLIDIVFGDRTTAWLARQQENPSKTEVLNDTVKALANDKRLKERLASPDGEHTMATVLRRCVELDLDLGTKDIRTFFRALKTSGVHCDAVRIGLESFVLLSAGLSHPAVKNLLMDPTPAFRSPEDTLIDLVMLLKQHNLLGSSQNLGHIYSGLPADIKAVTKCINLPLSELRDLRQNLKDPRIRALLSSDKFKKLSKEDAFIELVCALEQHNLLGSSQNLGHIYTGLPAEIKAVTKCINLPLSELRSIQSFLCLRSTVAWIESHLPDYPREERLQLLLERYNGDTDNKTNRRKLFQALPSRLSPSIYKRDLTIASLRLDLPKQTVFFDSNEERIVAQLLFKYGLINEFIEGRNLHVISGKSRISLDFKIGNVFLEYHPLSRKERDAGLTLEGAGARKVSSVSHERYPDHEVIHIWKLRQLHEVLINHPKLNAMLSPEFQSLSKQAFLQDLRTAKATGHKIDRAVQAGMALAF